MQKYWEIDFFNFNNSYISLYRRSVWWNIVIEIQIWCTNVLKLKQYCWYHVSYRPRQPLQWNLPNSQIPECTCFISHNAPFITKRYWMENCGIWNSCILRFVKLVYCFDCFIILKSFEVCRREFSKPTWWKRQLTECLNRCPLLVAYLVMLTNDISNFQAKVHDYSWGISLEIALIWLS